MQKCAQPRRYFFFVSAHKARPFSMVHAATTGGVTDVRQRSIFCCRQPRLEGAYRFSQGSGRMRGQGKQVSFVVSFG